MKIILFSLILLIFYHFLEAQPVESAKEQPPQKKQLIKIDTLIDTFNNKKKRSIKVVKSNLNYYSNFSIDLIMMKSKIEKDYPIKKPGK